MSRVIRHAESDKRWPQLGQDRPLTMKGASDALQYGQKTHEPHIVTSPKTRAVQTGEAIFYGSTGTYNNSLPIDPRLDIVNFTKEHSPDTVGSEEAYRHCIDKTPERMIEAVGRQACFLLDHLAKETLGTSHETPISLFQYMVGLEEENNWDVPNLRGYQFRESEDGVLFTPHHSTRIYRIHTSDLESLAEERLCAPLDKPAILRGQK